MRSRPAIVAVAIALVLGAGVGVGACGGREQPETGNPGQLPPKGTKTGTTAQGGQSSTSTQP
jgi:hypothetical protein